MQTFENVLVQGGTQYKKRLISKEAALRLLLIAQSNTRNESLQSSSGMALAHMIHLIIIENPIISTTQGGLTGVTTLGTTELNLQNQNQNQVPGTLSGTQNQNPHSTITSSSSRKLSGSSPLARVNASKGGTLKGDSLGLNMPPQSPNKNLGVSSKYFLYIKH